MKRTLITAALAVVCPAALLADLTGTVTLQNGNTFSFDTGTTATSGGDILYTGNGITFQGSASDLNFGTLGATGYASLTQSQLAALQSKYNQFPLSAGNLLVDLVLAVHTNGGNYAKVLVTATSAGSITLEYDAYIAPPLPPPGTPTITDIENNSSLIPVGFPNSGVAPSTLIVIHGTSLANAGTPAVLQDSTLGLPLTLNGASISVTVNGATTHPAIYYTSPTQIDAVLPAATPVGTGTLTVTYNNAPSAPATIQVVSSALGIDTYNGGIGVATDAVTYALLTPTNSGRPGENITLWGTGLGADLADSDTTYTTTPHPVSGNLQVYIGGVQAPILYQGATVYPGVDVIVVTIPQSAPTGCYVPVVGVVGGVVSNTVTLPIAAGGGVCFDPVYGINGSQLSTLIGQSTLNIGILNVATTGPGPNGTAQTGGGADAIFSPDASYYLEGGLSPGGCFLSESLSGGGSSGTFMGLDAGTITLTGPSGSPITLTTFQSIPGSYQAQIPAGAIPSSGGTFTFTGSGGSKVGAFTVTVNIPNPLLSWTNQSAAATVTRSSGLQVTWTGGAAGSYVLINGSSSASGVNGTYTCITPAAAGQFTVPSYILLGLPAGTGTTFVENSTNATTFSASGLDYGSATGSVLVEVNSTYQ